MRGKEKANEKEKESKHPSHTWAYLFLPSHDSGVVAAIIEPPLLLHLVRLRNAGKHGSAQRRSGSPWATLNAVATVGTLMVMWIHVVYPEDEKEKESQSVTASVMEVLLTSDERDRGTGLQCVRNPCSLTALFTSNFDDTRRVIV